MSFSIQTFEADPSKQIISVDWKYTTNDGWLSNTLKLATPAGNEALENITEDVLISWVEEQLPNTAQELSDFLAEQAARVEAESQYVKYELGEDNSYSVV